MSVSKLVDQVLQSSDFGIILELSDMLKIKKAKPSVVLSDINDKMTHTNISSAVTLLDCLIKNSGPDFINELNQYNNIFNFIKEYIQNVSL